jgi:hypothetical protein
LLGEPTREAAIALGGLERGEDPRLQPQESHVGDRGGEGIGQAIPSEKNRFLGQLDLDEPTDADVRVGQLLRQSREARGE